MKCYVAENLEPRNQTIRGLLTETEIRFVMPRKCCVSASDIVYPKDPEELKNRLDVVNLSFAAE
jgi:hypothetical protein